MRGPGMPGPMGPGNVMREPPMGGLGGPMGGPMGMGWRRMLDSREGEPDEYSSRGTRKARSRETGNKGL